MRAMFWREVRSQCGPPAQQFNPNRLGRFCKFSKKSENEFYIINISTTTRTRETNCSALERSGIGLPFWSGEPLSPRPILQIFLFPISPLRGYSTLGAARGFVVTTGYYWGFLHKDLLWKGMWLVFSINQRLLRKLDFDKN